MPINTGNFAKALYPGVNTWYGKAYNEHPTEYTDLFELSKSSRAYEEDVGITSFGLAPVKNEGSAISYDEERQAFLTRYVHVVRALGFVITREMFEDDLYSVAGERKAKGLAFSMRQTKEIIGANVYNNAFAASGYTGGDGSVLCATDHANFAGGTWGNRPSTDAALSEAALEAACIAIEKWQNDRGLQISVIPNTLLVPPDLVFEADRILNTPLRVGTADNDINSLRAMGKFPGGVKVNHYFSSTTAWFLKTNAPNGMKCYKRRAMEFAIDNDFDTENAKYKATERYSFGWTDARGMYGTDGTP